MLGPKFQPAILITIPFIYPEINTYFKILLPEEMRHFHWYLHRQFHQTAILAVLEPGRLIDQFFYSLFFYGVNIFALGF